MKGGWYFVLIISSGILGMFVGGLVETKQPLTFVKDYLPSLTTLIGAFVGAWLAFEFQRQGAAEKARKENLAAGNRTILLLAQYVNELELIRRQVIDPVKNDPARFISMRAILLPPYDHLRCEVGRLEFLFEQQKGDLLAEVLIEEFRFHQAIDAIQYRSKIHISEVQPQLEKAGVIHGAQYVSTVGEFKRLLGERLLATLVEATDDAIKHVESTIMSCTAVALKLNTALKTIFPKERVISFEIAKP